MKDLFIDKEEGVNCIVGVLPCGCVVACSAAKDTETREQDRENYESMGYSVFDASLGKVNPLLGSCKHADGRVKCDWKEDCDGNWETECNSIFVFIDGGPKMNGMNWCPYCGKRLVVVPFSDTEEP